jgi:hypothetical protein
MLVNPRKRRATKKTSGARRRRNPVRRMSAKQRAYFAPKKARRSRRRRNPVMAMNPRRTRRRRRNPIGGASFNPKRVLGDVVIPSAIGAIGAIGVDMVWNMLPIPAQFKVGPLGVAAKIAGAVAIGMIASKAAGKKIGAAVTNGAVLVTIYDVAKGMIRTAAPALPMSEYVSGLGYVQAGQFLPMSEYVSGGASASLSTAFADTESSDVIF